MRVARAGPESDQGAGRGIGLVSTARSFGYFPSVEIEEGSCSTSRGEDKSQIVTSFFSSATGTLSYDSPKISTSIDF